MYQSRTCCQDSPTCSVPLNTYNLQLSKGFRASGGSLYFKTVLDPSPPLTVLVAAANKPDGAKFGLPLLGSAVSEGDFERGRGDLDRGR